MVTEEEHERRKVLLIFGLVALLAVGGVGAIASYTVGQITGTVTVAEPITYSPHTFPVDNLMPGESATQTITLTNGGTVAITVSPTVTVNPPTGLTALVSSSSVSVPAGGSNTFTVTYTAVNPGSYTIAVGLSR